MTTVGNVVDRVMSDALYGADDQPLTIHLAASLTDSATAVTYDTGELTPDEEGALTVGVIIEFGLEQMRITDFVESGSLTVRRGSNGTTAAAHANSAEGIVAPTFPRQSVFNAVCDAVTRLYPTLWRQRLTTVSTANPYAALPGDVDQIVGVRHQINSRLYSFGFELLSDLDTDGAKGLIVYDVGEGKSVDVVYRTGFDRPTLEADTFTTLGLREDWQRILIVDAVSHIMSGTVEVNRATQNWLTEELSNTSYTPLTSARFAAQMDQYRQNLMRDAAAALVTSQRRHVRRRNPFERVVQW